MTFNQQDTLEMHQNALETSVKLCCTCNFLQERINNPSIILLMYHRCHKYAKSEQLEPESLNYDYFVCIFAFKMI